MNELWRSGNLTLHSLNVELVTCTTGSLYPNGKSCRCPLDRRPGGRP